jgi:hypothetical protein
MAKLYEINSQIENFDFEIDEETGEILNFKELENLEIERAEKIENIALWYKNLLSDAEAFKAEEKAFKERREQAEKKAESLKNYLNFALMGETFKTVKVEIKYRKSESVNVTDVSKLAREYLTIVEPKPNKTAIKKAIKDGKIIEGAEIIVNNNIQIK